MGCRPLVVKCRGGAADVDRLLRSGGHARWRVDPLGNRVAFDVLLRHALVIAPKLTIQGGTTEVLRGIIARGLGLR